MQIKQRILTNLPLLLLLLINLAAGLILFKDAGISWDEPLFYDYADSIRLAYTPQAFSNSFDFEQVFGKSPEDHKIYGPAYILLARPFEEVARQVFDATPYQAWHLVNFLTLQFGLLIFYLLARRWLEPFPAAAAAAFFGWQPVIWGHGFINPKDIPFMVAFLTAIYTGLLFIDRLAEIAAEDSSQANPRGFTFFRSLIPWLLLSGLCLGLAASTRVIGPLAGAVVGGYFLLKFRRRGLLPFLGYGLLAVLVMWFFWPYLWADPLQRFLDVFKHMSNNPTELAVLFEGQIFHANDMPRRYLPQMLALTLTEPVWPLFVFGLAMAGFRALKKRLDWRPLLATLGYAAFMVLYILYNKPAMYDGFRHFIFLLPPVFLLAGFVFQWLWEKTRPALGIALVLLALTPGLLGIVQLHPYEYTYYNSFAGGVGGAFRVYETDFWLTCYGDAFRWAAENAPGKTLHVQREFELAQAYQPANPLKDLGKESEADLQPGDLLLFNTRANLDIRSVYRKLPIVHTIGRGTASYCLIKQK